MVRQWEAVQQEILEDQVETSTLKRRGQVRRIRDTEFDLRQWDFESLINRPDVKKIHRP